MQKPKPLIGLTDRGLFGNDAAEDEDERVFLAYAVERDEVKAFLDPTERLRIVRAYKGEGKSALLRLTRLKLLRSAPATPVVSATASSLVPPVSSPDTAPWVRAWKAAILSRLAAEIGATIGFAWEADGIGLVEEAENGGFKKRNLLFSILSRLKPDLPLGAVTIPTDSGHRPGTPNPEASIRRYAEGRKPLWLFFDDIDQNFQNTPELRAKISAFFIACRELTNAIPELRIRAAVRPNVWTTLKVNHEALSHLEQYVSDLTWTEASIRSLLARRVEGYLRLSDAWQFVSGGLPTDPVQRERFLIGRVFDETVQWGSHSRPVHVVLYTLSMHRPRWTIELCKLAAQRAHDEHRAVIVRDDIAHHLASFGQRRIQDTEAEFSSQCPELAELITAFRGEPEELSTDVLLKTIDNKILTHVSPHLVGVVGPPSNRDIAAFLFQIGFFFGRLQHPDGSYDHITYPQRPHLFASRTSVDDGLTWEIHPVFRQVLGMRDAQGRPVPQQRQGSRPGR